MIPAGGTFGGKHTYDDFGLIPKSKIIFNPPSVKKTIVDIPEGNGHLDYTGLLTGNISYNNRVGTIEFVKLTGDDYAAKYSQMLSHFHGQKMDVVLDDDPLFFYRGRFEVNTWKSKEGASTIAIDYDLEPFKYGFVSTGSMDWLWNDLFNKIIYYGTFNVSAADVADGGKVRNLINPSGIDLTPQFTCSAPMTVLFNNTEYPLPADTTDAPGFTLQPGDNIMKFKSVGNVVVDYVVNAEL